MAPRAPEHLRRRTCEKCGAEFQTKPSHRARFCSRTCKDEAQRTRAVNDPRPCIVCGTVWKPSRSHGDARFCSKRCEWKALKGREFMVRMSRESAELRGDLQRGKGTYAHPSSYVKYRGRHLHRVVAEQMLGRPLRPGEIVHHKDGDKLNNEPSNLEVMTQSEHVRRHGCVKGMDLWWKPWERRWKKAAQ